MASIRERIDSTGKKTYQVQVRIHGFPPQVETFKTKTEAKQWAAHVESELRAGRYMHRAEAQKHTVKDLLEKYRKEVLKPTKPKEERSQGPQLEWWIQKLGAYSLADLTPAAIAKCRDELLQTPFGRNNDRMRTPATVVRYIAVLSHAFNMAVKEWAWITESPVARVTRPTVNNERMRYLSNDEQVRLLEVAKKSQNTFLYTILITALSTGMRYSEIMNLRWRDVLLEEKDDDGLILLKTTKNGEPRGVPVVKSACVAIKTLRQKHAAQHRGHVKSDSLLFPSEDDPETPVEIRKAWDTALRRAEIANFRFHDLRHTAASYLAMEGATAPEIAEILGHKSLQMVKRYSHFNKDHIAKVMSKMNQTRFGDIASTPSESESTSVKR